MTTFLDLDMILRSWARDRRIPLYTKYRGEEVRSFQVVGATGRKAQIWVEVNDGISVYVWDYKKRKREFGATRANLPKQLDAALDLAMDWTR